MHFYLIFHELKIPYEKRTFSLHTHTHSLSLSFDFSKALETCICVVWKNERKEICSSLCERIFECSIFLRTKYKTVSPMWLLLH